MRSIETIAEDLSPRKAEVFEKYECTYFLGNIEMTLMTWGEGSTKQNALRRAKRAAYAIMQKKSMNFSLAIPSVAL